MAAQLEGFFVLILFLEGENNNRDLVSCGAVSGVEFRDL